jgi:PIN domain nuclease of toxin-antitoxin system
LPVTIEHGVAMLGFAASHGDPFDRLLIAQARCAELTIVTADRAFAAYDVPIMPAWLHSTVPSATMPAVIAGLG